MFASRVSRTTVSPASISTSAVAMICRSCVSLMTARSSIEVNSVAYLLCSQRRDFAMFGDPAGFRISRGRKDQPTGWVPHHGPRVGAKTRAASEEPEQRVCINNVLHGHSGPPSESLWNSAALKSSSVRALSSGNISNLIIWSA